MSMSVVVRKESGEELDISLQPIELSDLRRLASQVAMLRWLEPYGNTILNSRQAIELVQQIQEIDSAERADGTLLGEVLRLARMLDSHPHRYLWFIGD